MHVPSLNVSSAYAAIEQLNLRTIDSDVVNYVRVNAPSLTTIGAVDNYGLTPLGEAVSEGKLDTIKYLITECNVNINGKLVHAIQYSCE